MTDNPKFATIREYMMWILAEWESVSESAHVTWHPGDAWAQIDHFAQAYLRGYEDGIRP